MRISTYELRALCVPLDRSIGDSQIDPLDRFRVVTLELVADTGEVGVGFDTIETPLETIAEALEESVLGASPFAIRNRVTRPRGGKYGARPFDRLVDVAVWDLSAKYLDLPLYELMGGTDPRVPAYASGLAFHHDDETTRKIYEDFRDQGFDAAKVKVGYPSVEDDLERLALVRDVMREGCRLLVDANEAFSPKEAIRRTHRYREAGFDIYWFEDPILRDDRKGIRRVAEALPETHVNVGEYVGFEEKRALLEHGACDVLHVHGYSNGRREATLAAAYGVPVAFGNTPGEFGVHAAAALPEVTYLEYAALGWDRLLTEPVTFENEMAVAPDRPGHGLEVADSAVEQYGTDELERE